MLQGKFGQYVNNENVWEIWEEMYNKDKEKENKEEDNGDN